MNRPKLNHGIKWLKQTCRRLWKTADTTAREKAVEVLAYENEEREHIFALLVLGMFVGLPSPPLHLTMALAPLMERDMMLMLEKVGTAHDPLADLFAVLKID
jgi:hypothetical protein